jgi:hypothetical protein
MTQSELNREITQAIAETASTIKRLGFLLDGVASHFHDADSIELGPHIIDRDACPVVRSQSLDGGRIVNRPLHEQRLREASAPIETMGRVRLDDRERRDHLRAGQVRGRRRRR